MNKKNLLHGQALAMQWVGFMLQSVVADINAGGNITKQLLGSAKSVGNGNGLDTVALGCKYVVNFILPFAIELSIKSLLFQEGKDPKFVHDLFQLYNELSGDTKQKLQNEYLNQCKFCDFYEIKTFGELIVEHRNDFVDWRYLDNTEKLNREELNREEKKMQIAICTILEIYNTLI